MSTNHEQRSFESPDWFKALRLDERLAGLPSVGAAQMKIDLERAQRRLERWRSEPQFANGHGFAERLQHAELAEEQLLRLLGETSDSLRERSSAPEWFRRLEEAFSHVAEGEETDSIKALNARIDNGGLGFLALIRPLLHQSLRQLHQGIKALRERHSWLPFDPETIELLLLSNMPGPLLGLLAPTMALELNVSRLRGELEGETKELRFRNFLRRLQDPQFALGILQEYPVLARQLISRLDRWVGFSLEFLSHLCSDWAALCSVFSTGHDPGTITKVVTGAGDTHREGRSVVIATFSSGLRIVYKPRSFSVDRHFLELLEWANKKNFSRPFRSLKILDRGSYGWTEFVEAAECASVAEVESFYERLGGLLALLYALEATDFHFENLIAAGEHPVLIDLEALFQPRLDVPHTTQNPLEAANETMGHSVLRIGLLPQRMWTNKESDGIDLSGMGGAPGQATTHLRAQTWANAGTDEMHLIRERTVIKGSQNRPSLRDAEIGAQEYAGPIVAGFMNMYHLILNHRDELLDDDKLGALFGNDEVRAILRPSHVYASLLNESFHPDVLRDGLDRDRLFDFLWARVKQMPCLAPLIPFEQADLQRGDIPFFTARPASRDLWTSDGKRIAEFFATPSLELARRRLQMLSEDDLSRQVWFIRASLATLTIGVSRKSSKYPLSAAAISPGTPSHEQLVAAARTIGERIATLALHKNEDVAWVGVTLLKERTWHLLPLGTDLYDGAPGVILFLAYLGSITGEGKFTELARQAMRSCRRQIAESPEELRQVIGAFNGRAGWIYLLTHLGMLWGESSLLDEAESNAREIAEFIEADTHLDIISGTAGTLGALLALHRSRPSPHVLKAALRCGDHLVSHARAMPQGVAWDTEVPSLQPLTGFSHGAAGIAWSLLELFDVTGAERFREIAREAIAYERSVFSAAERNWPDFRAHQSASEENQDQQLRYAALWCHGAGGIALSRLAAVKHLDGPEIRADVENGLRTTLSEGFGYNHSLCHGDLGNIEVLLEAGNLHPAWTRSAERKAGDVLAGIKEHGWLCGVPHEVESPGLMTGLAGIGYGLLRVACPDRIPSVLLLEGPFKWRKS